MWNKILFTNAQSDAGRISCLASGRGGVEGRGADAATHRGTLLRLPPQYRGTGPLAHEVTGGAEAGLQALRQRHGRDHRSRPCPHAAHGPVHGQPARRLVEGGAGGLKVSSCGQPEPVPINALESDCLCCRSTRSSQLSNGSGVKHQHLGESFNV